MMSKQHLLIAPTSLFKDVSWESTTKKKQVRPSTSNWHSPLAIFSVSHLCGTKRKSFRLIPIVFCVCIAPLEHCDRGSFSFHATMIVEKVLLFFFSLDWRHFPKCFNVCKDKCMPPTFLKFLVGFWWHFLGDGILWGIRSAMQHNLVFCLLIVTFFTLFEWILLIYSSLVYLFVDHFFDFFIFW